MRDFRLRDVATVEYIKNLQDVNRVNVKKRSRVLDALNIAETVCVIVLITK